LSTITEKFVGCSRGSYADDFDPPAALGPGAQMSNPTATSVAIVDLIMDSLPSLERADVIPPR
jgi:hypothetical protein